MIHVWICVLVQLRVGTDWSDVFLGRATGHCSSLNPGLGYTTVKYPMLSVISQITSTHLFKCQTCYNKVLK